MEWQTHGANFSALTVKLAGGHRSGVRLWMETDVEPDIAVDVDRI